MDGFLFLNKAKGITSREACDQVGKLFNTKKIGHVGTLDPFATGLLIVSINKGTKAGTFFDDFSKRYIATIKLGEKTDSLDLTGKVIERKPVPKLTREEIEKVLSSFLGKNNQIPPMTSAVHINGKKLYEYAHKGIEVERPAREIEIYDIKLISFKDDEIVFESHVSKGTYIRVLGSDIAEKLGTCGHLTALERINLGPFSLSEAVSLEGASIDKIVPISTALMRFSKVIKVDEEKALDVKNGKYKTYPYEGNENKLLIVDEKDNPIAMYVKINKEYVFRRGLF